MKLFRKKKPVKKLTANVKQDLRAKYLMHHSSDDEYSGKGAVIGIIVIIIAMLFGFHIWHDIEPNGMVPSTTHYTYEELATYPQGIRHNMQLIQKERVEKQSPQYKKEQEKENQSLWQELKDYIQAIRQG